MWRQTVSDKKDDVKGWLEAASKVETFSPTHAQWMAKERLKSARKNKTFLVDESNLRLEDLEAMCGSKSIEKWAKSSPMFLWWLLDKDFEETEIQAFAQAARRKVHEIMMGDPIEKIRTAKDQLKAAEIILNLADHFPAKKKEVKWLDKDLEDMSEDVVQVQLAEARRKIKGEE